MDWKDEAQVRLLIDSALFEERQKTENLIRDERDRRESKFLDRIILLIPIVMSCAVILKYILK